MRSLFYVESLPGVGGTAVVDGDEGHHAATVRRTRVGEELDLSDGAGTADRLGTRISTALSEGAQGAGEALGNVIVWCAYHLIALLVLAAAAAVVLAVCLRRRKKRAAPPAASAPAEPPAQE